MLVNDEGFTYELLIGDKVVHDKKIISKGRMKKNPPLLMNGIVRGLF